MPEPFERLLKASLREADKGTASLCAYRHAQAPANLCQDTQVLYQRHLNTHPRCDKALPLDTFQRSVLAEA